MMWYWIFFLCGFIIRYILYETFNVFYEETKLTNSWSKSQFESHKEVLRDLSFWKLSSDYDGWESCKMEPKFDWLDFWVVFLQAKWSLMEI